MKVTLILVFALLPMVGAAQKNKRVKVVYKSHTSFDFTGDKVTGKIRAPAIFYVFQRKRSEGHKVIIPPLKFDGHKTKTNKILTTNLK